MTVHETETDTHYCVETFYGTNSANYSRLWYCKCCDKLDSPDSTTPGKFVATKVFNGDEFRYEFYSHGVLNRDGDLPAIVEEEEVNEYGTLLTRKSWSHFYRDGKLHRDNGPAKIRFRDGFICEKYFYKDGVKVA